MSDANRAYIFLHYNKYGCGGFSPEPVDSYIAVLLGAESMIHPRALAEMREKLGSAAGRAQCRELAEKLADNKPVLTERGEPRLSGPWYGQNFGGTLLIARPSLPGGRIKGNENVERGALRELWEEYRLPEELFQNELVMRCAENLLAPIHTHLDPSRPRMRETYFSLDLDVLRECVAIIVGDKCAKELDPDNLIDAFDNCSVDSEGEPTVSADSAEKRELFEVLNYELEDNFSSSMRFEDQMYVKSQADILARHVAAVADLNGTAVIRLADQIEDYQKSRTQHSTLAAASEFYQKSQKFSNKPARAVAEKFLDSLGISQTTGVAPDAQ